MEEMNNIEEINYIEKYNIIEKKFKKYLKSNYDMRKPKIKHKFEHTFRVVEFSEHIARDLNLDEENVYIAKLVALFHDIGRFRQIEDYDSYDDHKNIDHGKYGADLLFKENLIREFVDEIIYDNILKEAIYNHNKYDIESKRLLEQELLHIKIIRDADKTDAFYSLATNNMFKILSFTKEELENSLLSEKVYEDFMDEKTVLYTDIETPVDRLMSIIGYIFGYYFTSGLKIVQEKDYINIIRDKARFKKRDTINKIKNMFTLINNNMTYRIEDNINY